MTDKDRVPVHPFLCGFRNSGMSRAGLGYNRAMVWIQLVFRIIRCDLHVVHEDTCELPRGESWTKECEGQNRRGHARRYL